MPFLTVGIEHSTAPLTIRERVAMDPDMAARALSELVTDDSIDEVVILSTCNRTEVFLFIGDMPRTAAMVAAYLQSIQSDVLPYLRTWEEMDAVEHLFRVASGLESQVLGEAQILSQVSEALEIAQRTGTTGPNLHALFRAAISCARQARAGTALGRLNLSLGSEAVHAAATSLGGLHDASVLLIGGGEISRAVAEELRANSIGTLYIANRTETVAVDLANAFGGVPLRLSDLSRVLPMVDLVISATSAPHYVLTPEDISSRNLEEQTRPLHVFDLAIPRDVDPSVGSLPGIVLHDLDGLLPTGISGHWDEDIREIEGIIASEIHEFTAWYLTRRVVPVIASLRSHVEAVSQTELKRVAPQLKNLTEREREAVESLTGRLIDKMFHHLVLRLRLAAQTDPKLVDAAEFFFLHGEGGLFEHAAQDKELHHEVPERTT